jgi:hypothetical protein
MICDSVLGASQASFDTNTILGGNIPATYKHLRAVVTGRGDTAAVSTFVQMRFNNDSGVNYADQEINNNSASTLLTGEDNSKTYGVIGNIAAASATAGALGSTTVEIPDYNGTTFWKTWLAEAITHLGITTGLHNWYTFAGGWVSTAAITRLTFFPAAGNFVAGTRFTLYGLS